MKYVSARRLTLFFGVFMFIPAIASAQGPEMDATAYRGDSTRAIVEVTYGILYRLLPFKQSGNTWSAPISARAELWSGDSKIAEQKVEQTVTFKGTKEELEAASATKAIGVVNLPAPYAKQIRAVLYWNYTDNGTAKIDSNMSRTIATPAFHAEQLTTSGIELASKLEGGAADGDPLGKAGYRVTPNPSDVFGGEYPKLYYYFELYVPHSYLSSNGTATITAIVQDGNGKTIVTTTKSQPLLGENIPILGSLDIDGVPDDKYRLVITVTRNGSIETNVAKDFYFDSGIKMSDDSPTAAPVTATDEQGIFANSEFSQMSENDLNERFDQAQYIADSKVRDTWKTLSSLDAKRKFLFDFFRAQDKPGTQPLNAYRTYVQRTDEANKRFTIQKTPGWKTDMGRIYMKYGPPDRELQVPFSTEARPIVYWEYNNKDIQVNVLRNEESGTMNISATLPHFMFIDRQGGRKFSLVNSNVIGETPQPTWYSTQAKRTY